MTAELRTMERSTARHAAERALDQVLADSFPASDAPSWTLGVRAAERARSSGDVVDVSIPRARRTLLHGLLSFAGAAGIALVVPFAILLVGVPVVLAVRVVAEAVLWLLARAAG